MNRLLRTLTPVTLVVCTGCFPLQLPYTNHVRGIVVDTQTNQPVSGARLHYQDFPDRVVASGTDGHFDFPPIRRWVFWPLLGIMDQFHHLQLIVEAEGYEAGRVEYQYSGGATDETIALRRR